MIITHYILAVKPFNVISRPMCRREAVDISNAHYNTNGILLGDIWAGAQGMHLYQITDSKGVFYLVRFHPLLKSSTLVK